MGGTCTHGTLTFGTWARAPAHPSPFHGLLWGGPWPGVPAPPPPRAALGPQLRDLPSSETSQKLWTLHSRPWGAGVTAPHGKVAPPLSAQEMARGQGRRNLTQCGGFLQVRPASWAESERICPRPRGPGDLQAGMRLDCRPVPLWRYLPGPDVPGERSRQLRPMGHVLCVSLTPRLWPIRRLGTGPHLGFPGTKRDEPQRRLHLSRWKGLHLPFVTRGRRAGWMCP